MCKTILISGASGLVGTALQKELKRLGYELRSLRRSSTELGPNEFFWEPRGNEIDSEAFENIDGVIHLAGENIAGGRWTAEQKEKIYKSRIEGTKLISRELAKIKNTVTFVCASAVGYYGYKRTEKLDEGAESGDGFLAHVAEDWENATAEAKRAGHRVVYLRSGIIMSPEGGLLERLVPLFKLGLGGRLGSGKHVMSWIALDDLISAIVFLLKSDTEGPVNLVSPEPVTNLEFTRLLAHHLHRPAILPAPRAALELAFGKEMVRELFFSDLWVEPGVLQNAGFQFRYPTLDTYFSAAL